MIITLDNVRAIKDVLGGNVSELLGAFTWDDSPQLHRHWSPICDGVSPLDDDSRAYLEGLLSAHEARLEHLEEGSKGMKFSFRYFSLDGQGKLTSESTLDMGVPVKLIDEQTVSDRNCSRFRFQTEGNWREEVIFYGHFQLSENSSTCLVQTDEEGKHTIFGQLDPVHKAFGLKSLEALVHFNLRRIRGMFHEGEAWNYAASEVLESLVYTVSGIDHAVAIKSAHLFWTNFLPDGVEVYRNVSDLERGRRTKLKVGRFLRMVLPKATDAQIETLTDNYNERYQKREFVLKRSKDQEAFAHAYTGKMAKMLNPRTTSARKSLPNSCMQDVDIHGHSPAEVYASGDFEIIWLETPQRGLLGGRVVVYVPEEGTPQAGPVYGTCEHSLDLLEGALSEMGATMYGDRPSWDGARMKAIPVYGSSLLMCYCDMADEAEQDGDYLIIGEGPLELHTTQGYVGSEVRNRCECCEDTVYPEDEYTNSNGVVFCDSCYNDRYMVCELTGEEIDADEAVEVFTSQFRHYYRATVSNPGTIHVADWCDDYTGCIHTDELWLTEDMVTDVDGEFVSPRYAENNLLYVNDEYYSAEQLAEHGLDTDGNEINKDEEEAA